LQPISKIDLHVLNLRFEQSREEGTIRPEGET
jgi:hypothetical protein